MPTKFAPPGARARLTWRQLVLVYTLAVGLLAGSAYTMYVHFDFSHSPDTRSYLRMARGEFKSVRITHRYRVLVPLAAAAVAAPVEMVYARLWPQRAATEWPVRLGFYLVNTLLLAGAGLLMFRTCLLGGASPGAAALALAAVLSSRWAVYIAGLPLVDSLYMLVFALALYASVSGSAVALVACIVLGPHAKESFVFLIPWLLVFGRGAVRWPVQLAWLAGSLAVAYGVRNYIDAQVGAPPQESVTNALAHLENLGYSLRRLFSPKGAGELFSIFGFFSLALVAGLQGGRAAWRRWPQPLTWACLGLVAVVLVHMLLSGDLARMGYLAAPAFTVAFSRLLTYHPWFAWLRLGAATEPAM
ncbi:hypothetical protein F0P96_20065 [Hymenobacter busanensis]|uniref:Uncharacterized protein n=1 Tax=Hymenobacter busanensis TaxID=2607656 RepID=A0A7L4ZXE7_9BACT|nr:hypothetical protein [Hymenobacter busanensis]KAA9325300.1 hypothetical protein F0P96_20065 [Hymenobacter busanensis]QHJ07707.1 hypothetical protein GUY19_10575 [Hymenobacter busanensis]